MIGIIGSAGDLGTQLTDRIRCAGFPVATFDPNDKHSTHNSPGEVIEAAEISHWCAPPDLAKGIVATNEVVLHASVMDQSLGAKSNMEQPHNVSIVHLLMNKYNTVVLARGHHSPRAEQHLAAIGLKAEVLTILEHDMLMARTQLILALLCKSDLPELRGVDPKLLTPSGVSYLEALEARSAKWTPATIETLLRNPHAKKVVEGMLDVINAAHTS